MTGTLGQSSCHVCFPEESGMSQSGLSELTEEDSVCRGLVAPGAGNVLGVRSRVASVPELPSSGLQWPGLQEKASQSV